ncbi:hypothetical protein TCAL_03879 [Tigriopus californicus]|uniref:Uncharacterized protein n=1 Tax=Tigriopus californicus TaxID=6832 RepID=A0A553NDR8_TIGCA|nr:uncharacterized protein LOC131887551 [Tigriopus californicus]TRY63590.1 hypothetical protein TCAL_03879 [Tigriopus californicus]
MNTWVEEWLRSSTFCRRSKGFAWLVTLYLVLISQNWASATGMDVYGEESMPSEISEIHRNDGNVELAHVLYTNRDPWADFRDKKNMFLRSTRSSPTGSIVAIKKEVSPIVSWLSLNPVLKSRRVAAYPKRSDHMLTRALREEPTGTMSGDSDLFMTRWGPIRVYGNNPSPRQVDLALMRLSSRARALPEGTIVNRVSRSRPRFPEAKRQIGNGMWTRSLRSPDNQDMWMRSLKRFDEDMYMRSLRSTQLSPAKEILRPTRGDDMLTRSLRSGSTALNDMLARSLKKRKSAPSTTHSIAQRGDEILIRSLRSMDSSSTDHLLFKDEDQINRELRSKNTRQGRAGDSSDMLTRSLRSNPLKTLSFNDLSAQPMAISASPSEEEQVAQQVAQQEADEPDEAETAFSRKWEVARAKLGEHPQELAKLFLRLSKDRHHS